MTKSHIESNIELDMKEPGELLCEATNDKGTASDTVPIRVTDVPVGFDIFENPTEVVVGDDIVLTCAASTYDYVTNLTWFRRGKNKKETTTNIGFITNRRGQYSFWSQLTINNINKTNSGEYICRTEKVFDEEVEERTRRITVSGE